METVYEIKIDPMGGADIVEVCRDAYFLFQTVKNASMYEGRLDGKVRRVPKMSIKLNGVILDLNEESDPASNVRRYYEALMSMASKG